MTDVHSTDNEALTPVKRALIEIRQLRAQLANLEMSRHEPIAVIGMGLRFPGDASDAEGFAQFLWSSGDAVTEIPADRWSLDALYSADPDTPGKMTTRHGAFLNKVDLFDAEFFGISPREAASMDPQQRLLMEVAWEALEDAGQAPDRLSGSRTGVYLGIANSDYGRALFARPEAIDPYFSTGNAYSVAAGRISYFLGAQGPSIAVDTACSSSLVAIHLACQGLRLGECDLALAGGVNLILTPEMNINFSKARMMAADGRCKTFDMAADGYVRGEGCGLIILRRLRDAIADGDRILAVVRGSAVNQDGRSGGLTAPNGPAQETVIRSALQDAQISADAIGYVETHGTGTPLGDPIEVGALGAVFGPGRDRRSALVIGSVKTNIGHLEAAAGIAGVIKTILALQRREIPAHLHFHTGNSLIDWAALPIIVPTAVMPWPEIEGRRLAGISSFGYGGTNAHVIIEQPPTDVRAVAQIKERPLHLLALSARNPTSLVELARRYQSSLTAEKSVADVCYTASVGRAHFAHRLAAIGASIVDLKSGLQAYVSGESNSSVATGNSTGTGRPQVAFLFTGQGAQYPGMGRRLYETSPAFRSALDVCAAGLAPHLKRGLLDVLFAQENAAAINDTEYAQPATFAIEYALSELWRSWGIKAAAMLGHSLGEYAAACAAGAISLGDALRLVAERGRLTRELSARDGAMGAVFAPHDVVAAEIGLSQGALTIAAYNGPENFVISGDRASVESALKRLEAAGSRVELLRVSYAAHSQLIEPVLPAFRRVLETVQFVTPHTTLVSNLSGEVVEAQECCRPDYWLAHMQGPVRFSRSMQTLAALGITHFVEVGPHPVLLGMGAECVTDDEVEWLPSLRRDRPDWSDLLESLQRLYVNGADVNWDGFENGYSRRPVAAPTYPFRPVRHWMDSADRSATPPKIASGLWARLESAVSRQAEQGPLDLNVLSYPEKWDCLARLTSAHAIRTLREQGVFIKAGERRTLDQVIEVSAIGVAYRHLVRRWLNRLVVEGVLRFENGAFVADAPLTVPDLPALWAEAELLLSDNGPLLAYVRNCGNLVGRVLSGHESPLETLFPNGSFALAEDLYERSTTMRYVNALAATAFELVGASLPKDRILRVLEVGAGTGGTTAGLLPILARYPTSYRFTDVSDLFLARAQERFANYPFVEYGRFDIDQEPIAQGYSPGGFDVIIAANAVHACTNLRSALRHLHELLAPGGLLILIESTTHFAWFDMTTGLIEGWQHFADNLRTDHPLLAADDWIAAFRNAGFEDAGFWPKAQSPAAQLGQHVLIARVAGKIAGTIGAAVETRTDTNAGVAAPTRSDMTRQRILDALPVDRLELLREIVRARVMQILRLDQAEPPGGNDRLMDLGFDSLMAVQLRNQLGKEFGFERALPASLMFDHPTINALASYLLERIDPQESKPPSKTETAIDQKNAPLGAAAVAAMSDTEIEAALLDRLGTI